MPELSVAVVFTAEQVLSVAAHRVDHLIYARAKEAWEFAHKGQRCVPGTGHIRTWWDHATHTYHVIFTAQSEPATRKELSDGAGDHASGVQSTQAGTEALVRPE